MSPWMILVVFFTVSEAAQNCVPQTNWVECICRDGLENAVFTAKYSRSESGKWSHKVENVNPACSSNSTVQWLREMYDGSLTIEATMAEKGYERLGNGFYKFHTVSQTWENARRTCEEEGAHLAIINSDYEAGLLTDLFKRYPTLRNVEYNDFVYMGFHDIYNEAEYLTIFGEPIAKTGYTRWRHIKGNNYGWNIAGNPGEDCGCIYRDGELDDIHCDSINAFICELEDEPAPPPEGIDYSAGAYKGVEKVIKPLPGTVPRTDAGEGYEFFPGVGFYRFHADTEVWENARRTCEKEGAHLAIVNSEEEARVLSQIFLGNRFIQDSEWAEFAFVGFHDQFHEGEFLTIYGEPLASTGYSRWWAAGEPNDLGNSNIHSGQDCGGFHMKGGFNDLACNKKHPFFCEKELFQ